MRVDHWALEETARAAGSVRRAARSLTRLYDVHLARVGLTTSQFSILRTVQRRGGRMPLADLATDLVFERTSLYRALVPLRRAGLVSVRTSTDRRARSIALTARGHRGVAGAMPHWAAAQRSVLEGLGHAAWTDMAAQLGHLGAIARSAHPE